MSERDSFAGFDTTSVKILVRSPFFDGVAARLSLRSKLLADPSISSISGNAEDLRVPSPSVSTSSVYADASTVLPL